MDIRCTEQLGGIIPSKSRRSAKERWGRGRDVVFHLGDSSDYRMSGSLRDVDFDYVQVGDLGAVD
jgi:hypothetical protein